MRSINRRWIFALGCHGRYEIGFVGVGASGEAGGSDNGSGCIPVRGAFTNSSQWVVTLATITEMIRERVTHKTARVPVKVEVRFQPWGVAQPGKSTSCRILACATRWLLSSACVREERSTLETSAAATLRAELVCAIATSLNSTSCSSVALTMRSLPFPHISFKLPLLLLAVLHSIIKFLIKVSRLLEASSKTSLVPLIL